MLPDLCNPDTDPDAYQDADPDVIFNFNAIFIQMFDPDSLALRMSDPDVKQDVTRISACR